jgi:hypothetical protein
MNREIYISPELNLDFFEANIDEANLNVELQTEIEIRKSGYLYVNEWVWVGPKIQLIDVVIPK